MKGDGREILDLQWRTMSFGHALLRGEPGRSGETNMSLTSTAYEYRQRADHCLEIARVVARVRHRKMVLDMAEAWLKLAEQAERTRNPFAPYQNARRQESPH